MSGTVSWRSVLKREFPLEALARIDADAPAFRASYLRTHLAVTEGLTPDQVNDALEIIRVCVDEGKPMPTLDELLVLVGHVAPEPA